MYFQWKEVVTKTLPIDFDGLPYPGGETPYRVTLTAYPTPGEGYDNTFFFLSFFFSKMTPVDWVTNTYILYPGNLYVLVLRH